MVQAKFQFHSGAIEVDDLLVFNANAVYSQEGENASFSKATPSGSLTVKLSKDHPAAAVLNAAATAENYNDRVFKMNFDCRPEGDILASDVVVIDCHTTVPTTGNGKQVFFKSVTPRVKLAITLHIDESTPAAAFFDEGNKYTLGFAAVEPKSQS